MNKFLRFGEYIFIILGLTFFSGAFGINSLGLILPSFLITLVRFFILGCSTILICVFWQSTIKIVSRNILLFLLSIIAFFSFIWSEFPDYTLSNARDIWMMTSFSLYFASRFSLKEQIKLVAYTLLIGGILSILCALGLPQVGKHITAEHTGAWKGIYGHKNSLGSTMLLGSLTCFYLPINNFKIFKYFGFGFLFLLMLTSTSRTALVLFGLILLIMFIYQRFRWRGKISVILLDMGILVLGCFTLGLVSYWAELLTGLGRDPTLTGRIPIWSVMINRLMERPWLGFGRGAFFAPHSPYAIEVGQVIGSGWHPPHGHNGFLDLAIDFGLIGLSLFLITYFTTFTQVLKQAYATRKPEELWLLAFMFFLILNNITESLLLYQTNLYWVLFLTIAFTVNQVKFGKEMPEKIQISNSSYFARR
ncbi:MAG: O-antigen ligase family protein [Calothrix sp. MO_192.B10]|nr:O-antigen ligase family protein [Calothrix sp. MO_192.B10]